MSIDPFYNKEVDCLLCKTTFQTKRIRSSAKKVRNIESDFFSNYETENEKANPLFYHVNVCPHCGYSFSDDADSYFNPKRKQELKDKISAHWQQRYDYSEERTITQAVQAFKLAIFAGQIKKEKPIVMAGLHMRLSWIYRIQGDEENEPRFMEYALKAYEKSYFEGDYTDTEMSQIHVTYIIGELYRRVGDFQKASVYFSELIHMKDETKDRRYIEMAKTQWQIMREQQKAETELEQVK
ncbi:DUF2225 domain-containing protein [Alkalihalobacillus sp. LMS39]|uniref:DUF2225 domain-containing protein n=1 Tax=Alkalihalobacillus sp. LMS39 TaxID=2924032 RepID=UPI001FB54B05|nr:DUF2225 domain-containing protein [Alkalihalobacillus sp. LMS39]UOE92614.1 DUF2225 domain-containing protein [Alkalihalobacillus sp. LMS39]